MSFFTTSNPYTLQPIAEYVQHSPKAVDKILQQAEKGFLSWKRSTFETRNRLVLSLATHLRENNEEYAILISTEMGKNIKESRAEVEKCATLCEYYAQNAEIILQDGHEPLYPNNRLLYEPMGVIFAVMPWNFPFWQVIRFAVGAIMAGNTVVLKHAPNVLGCAVALENIFKKTGFPEGVFSNLIIDIPMIEAVVSNPIIKGVTLTGSNRAGASLASLAGRYVKKSVLELGGSDAFIVLNDADIERAAQEATTARMQNAGQSCIAGKRFIIEKGIYEPFLELFSKKIKKIGYGNPFDETLTMGTMARPDLALQLEQQLQKALAEGAKLQVGGSRQDCLFAPTLLSNCPTNSIVAQEEIFGPLAAVFKVENVAEAIVLANNSPYGLGASVWSAERENAKLMARELQAGSVFLNRMVKSDPRLPFGGTKQSGYGYEMGAMGLREFCHLKVVAW